MVPKCLLNDVQMMSKWCPQDLQMMSKWSPINIQMMSKGCPNDVQFMSKGCPIYVQLMSKNVKTICKYVNTCKLNIIWTSFGHHIWTSFGHHLDIIQGSSGHHLGSIWTSFNGELTFIFREITSGVSRGRSPLVKQGGWWASTPPTLYNQKWLCFTVIMSRNLEENQKWFE